MGLYVVMQLIYCDWGAPMVELFIKREALSRAEARVIALSINLAGYPQDNKLFFSMTHCSQNKVESEHILQIRMAWLYGIPLTQCRG